MLVNKLQKFIWINIVEKITIIKLIDNSAHSWYSEFAASFTIESIA
jgi:hypothetical protein